jgi:acetyl-CoA synthetase
VVEAAAVGVPDSTKGETVWAFWVPRPGIEEDVSAELRELVATQLGKPFAPSLVRRVAQLPKTRSQKIMRRAVRAAALGTAQADLSGAENPGAIEDIRAAVGDAVPK